MKKIIRCTAFSFVLSLFMFQVSGQLADAKGITLGKSVYAKFPAPKKGGTFYDLTRMNPVTLNPILITNIEDRELASLLFMRLMTRDPESWDMTPGLCNQVESSPDNKEYTFTLRPEAKWTDGSPVTADDMIFTFNKIMDPKVEAAAIRSFLNGVTIEKIDDRKFKFKVEVPKYNTLDFVSELQPIQKKQFENESDFNKSKENLRPIGNMAYKVKSISRDQSVIFERVPGWWGEKLPELRARFNFDQVHFRIIPDDALSYERFIKGELDAISLSADKFAVQVRGVDKEKVGTKQGSGKNVWADEFKSQGTLPWFGMALNYKNPIFSLKTRQALAYLVDYATVIEKAFFKLPMQSVSPFGSNSENLDPELKRVSNRYRLDIKKAAKLLKEDGWADTDADNILDKVIDGKKTSFRFVFMVAASSPAAKSTGQILKESFKKAGIEMDVRPQESASFYKDFDDKNFDAAFMGWTGGSIYPDPKQNWHTESIKNGSNAVGYSNPKVDALIEKANLEFNRAKRAKLLQEIGKILYQELPYIFLVERDYVLQGLNSRVQAPRWIFKYSNLMPKDIFYFKE